MLAKATKNIVVLVTLTAVVAATSVQSLAGIGFARSRAVGGIIIDSSGIVHRPTELQTREMIDAMKLADVPGDLKQLNTIRKVSLKQLQQAIAANESKQIADLPDSVKYLAGIQRIKYVFVYPEQNDIVLAGPGEGWIINESGAVVGETTGRPVVLLEDLLVAFRTVHAARQGGISCSIDPTPEGRARFQQFIRKQARFTPQVLDGIAEALGKQQVTLAGVPETSHFARVLVAADYHMKSIAMQLTESPVKELDSYLEMIKKTRVKASNITPRWWLASDYEPLAKSDDGLAYEIRGQGVKAMTENDLIQADGTSVPTGKSGELAQKWADHMTANYEELSKKNAVFGQLRNVMDLSVIAALVEHDGLRERAACDLSLLMNAGNSVEIHEFNAPKTIDTQCSFVKRGGEYIITASGGVMLESWQAASRSQTSQHVKELRASTKHVSGENWWWN
ncbi:MAG: DUF1598 domain-containing protein [Planctomycetales bacterium]|nr:DUF1598 domain-containing protein [Planctomycetales bacterium]